jgi:hypothetical protein
VRNGDSGPMLRRAVQRLLYVLLALRIQGTAAGERKVARLCN